MFQITLLALVLALSWSYAIDGEEWALYKKKFNKTYTNEEDLRRRAIWRENTIKVKRHNELYAQGKTSFSLKENKFSDMKFFEKSGTLNGNIVSVEVNEVPVSAKLVTKANDLPDSIDWREKKGVTEVKDQGKGETCWAFAAVAAVESHHLISTGNYVLLSESNLVDCANFISCSSLADPFQYIIDNKGIATAASYPYKETRGPCEFSSSEVGAQIKSYVQLQRGNENALMEAIAKKGPVAVGINSEHHKFQHYHNGIFDEPDCNKTIDHAVLVVGYGTTTNGQEYWILKNSWGTLHWGEAGYMKIARNKNNMCGIGKMAVYPVVGGISGQESLTHSYMFLYALILHKLYF